ncbi:hypothetical protein MF408_05735 [Nocardioides sp. TF02-7]|nr:hypothetical protein MF408_05735 [Nocardioides sp. TF02-7]
MEPTHTVIRARFDGLSCVLAATAVPATAAASATAATPARADLDFHTFIPILSVERGLQLGRGPAPSYRLGGGRT